MATFAETFRYDRENDTFISRAVGDYLCPPFVIARVATESTITGEPLEFSGMPSVRLLGMLKLTTVFYDKDVPVAADLAIGLRDIGKQLLALNSRGEVQPPLTIEEEMSIQHMERVVDAYETVRRFLPPTEPGAQ